MNIIKMRIKDVKQYIKKYKKFIKKYPDMKYELNLLIVDCKKYIKQLRRK